MKKTLLIGSAYAHMSQHPVRQDIVDEIKAKTTKWKPREVTQNHFSNVPLKQMLNTLGSLEQGGSLNHSAKKSANFNILNQISGLFGVSTETFGSFLQTDAGNDDERDPHIPENIVLKEANEELRPKKALITGDSELPSYYNVREAYPMCKPEILDQGMCGSCWAFSSSGVLSDRFCIKSEGQIDVTLSPQDMVNCDFENFGCNGGYMVPAIDFLITEGVTNQGCMDYAGAQNSCSFRCDDQEGNYDKYYCKPGSLNIETSIGGMQKDILENGPVMVGLMVYEDLYNYESGVYEYTTGKLAGGHAIRALGWGHDDDGHLYWICQNQWTETWGENGYVNIKAGEIGIDTWTLSCQPDMKITKLD